MDVQTDSQYVGKKALQPSIMVALSTITSIAFLYLTGLAFSPMLLFIIGYFLLFPYRKTSFFISRLLTLHVSLFFLWLLVDLNVALLPFAIAFLIAFLLDPIITALEKVKIKRWLGSLIMLAVIGGIVSSVAIFVFPLVYEQLDQVIKQVSKFVNSTTDFLESRQFYSLLSSIGIPRETVKELVQTQLMPKIEVLFKTVLEALFTLLTNVSIIATQVLNLILIPILSFYFLKDLPSLKQFLRDMLSAHKPKVLHDLTRISDILKLYVGWQLIAVIWIGTAASLFLSLFHIPYAIVLGVMCGLLNPIPFFGTIASMLIGSVVALLVDPTNAISHIIGISLIVNGLHFLNAYIIEPRVLGTRVGLHPVVLLASLFVFGHFFGFMGLLIAVPSTAVLMMFFRDWQSTILSSEQKTIRNERAEDQSKKE